MRQQRIISCIISFFLLAVVLSSQGRAQEKSIPQKQEKVSSNKEMVLKAFHVEARIEKPSVSIVPKRIEPKLKEVEFVRRSFSQQIKNVPRELLYLEMKESKKRQITEAKIMLKKERK